MAYQVLCVDFMRLAQLQRPSPGLSPEGEEFGGASPNLWLFKLGEG
jgi:hypothetical protein